MIDCDCTEEYGPCEQHGEVLAQREGASTRTADELCAVFLDDVLGIVPDALSPYGRDVKARADAALESDRRLGVAWLSDLALADELRSVCDQAEGFLPDGVVTFWEDGYRIVRIIGGPLAEQ